MAGSKYRIKTKTKANLSRQIRSDATEKELTLEQADAQIRDVLRYTMVYKEKDFTGGYFVTLEQLKEMAFPLFV